MNLHPMPSGVASIHAILWHWRHPRPIHQRPTPIPTPCPAFQRAMLDLPSTITWAEIAPLCKGNRP